ncbi:MAG: hypothetical protein LBR27_10610 [Bifidobacteriaceae bacterium]|nr:hypothetical protein [Bifidobacteriaceae bacterium]
MQSFLHPVGPEPPGVYWRRRAVVLGGLIIVIVVVFLIINALVHGGDDEGDKKADGKATDTPTAQVSADEGAGDAAGSPSAAGQGAATAPACSPTKLSIIIRSDKNTYTSADIPVTFTAEVENTGTADCSITLNDQSVDLTVTSGTDLIFDTKHCAVEGGTTSTAGGAVDIAAGAKADIPLTWNGQRSNDKCDDLSNQLPARSSDATYHATVNILGAQSDDTQFILAP